MIVDIVDKYCTNDNNPIKKPTLKTKITDVHISMSTLCAYIACGVSEFFQVAKYKYRK